MVLEAVSLSVQQFPELKLWCCFGTAPLRQAVEARIAGDPRLQDRVTLLGAVPHAEIETLMNASDAFVLGSHCEGSGYALIEAMACGLPAAVTDIPPFRALLGRGGVGEMGACGDAHSLRLALARLLDRSQQPLRSAVRAHFDRELSFEALGRKWRAAYCELGAANGNS
jgi:glycosyltransferase involved in cell wall biosynthesis